MRPPEGLVEEKVRIPSGELVLEGVLAYPQEDSPRQAVLLLAPHPHMGGNLDNNVVRHLAWCAAEDGAVTLRFNYRGVGESGIALPEGLSRYDFFAKMEAERSYGPLLEDALAAHRWLAKNANLMPMGPVVGYSLGAVLAGLMARESPVSSIIGIGPPNRRLAMDCFERCPAQKIFVGGDHDFAFDMGLFELEMRQFPGSNTFLFFPNADHFFRGQEDALYALVRPALWPEQEH